MDRLQETVRKIYEEAEGGSITAFGAIDTSLPAEWTEFFRKKARGLRKEEVESDPEPSSDSNKGAEPEILPQILEGIIKRIEEIEARLDIIEEVEEKIEEEPEAIRKGVSPEIGLLRLELQGLHGELVNREGRKWQS